MNDAHRIRKEVAQRPPQEALAEHTGPDTQTQGSVRGEAQTAGNRKDRKAKGAAVRDSPYVSITDKMRENGKRFLAATAGRIVR